MTRPTTPAIPRRVAREHPGGRGPSLAPAALQAPHRSRLASVVAWLGYLVYGIPAALTIPALAGVVARFGLWPAVAEALSPALLTSAPLAAWIVYTALRRRGVLALAWLAATLFASALLLTTPLFFWAGPAIVIPVLEIGRLWHTRVRYGATATTAPLRSP